MIRPRERERGAFQSQQQGCFVGVVIVAILFAIALPSVFEALRSGKGGRCLERLLERATDPRAENARCPVADAPYPSGAELACPAPSGHLDSAPHVRREPDGWRLSQTLPAHSGGEIRIGANSGEARGAPGRASAHLKPGFASRYILGPLFVVVIGGFSLAMLAGAVVGIRRTGWGETAWRLVIAAVAGFVGWILLTSAAGSEEWTFERGRVTRTTYLLGARRATTTWAHALGVVPVGSGRARALRLVRVENGRLRAERIGDVPADRLDIAGWMSRAIE